MNGKKLYTIEKNNDTLTFTTEQFKVENKSVLHSGIYNRELTSTLFAAVLPIIYLFIVILSGSTNKIHFLIAGLLFFTDFITAMLFLFKKPLLNVTFDKNTELIKFYCRGVIKHTVIEYNIERLNEIKHRMIKIEPQNKEGIAFVEKIARQHGTVIPGFGKTEVYHILELVFDKEESRQLFYSVNENETKDAGSAIAEFINKPVNNKR
ncbi:membrane protein [Candidatus Magnetoovum chiemensis]|nr:membrane protein [Candidatus Magnetoovum chiemensis]